MKNIKYKLGLIFVLLATIVQAQTKTFQIQDENLQSLIGVTFTYAEQQGLSDESGNISFEYQKGATMDLSYLGFGQWQLNDTEILTAVENGFYSRKRVQKELQPVTIISMRQKSSEEDQIKFNFQEKMVHDGGELLSLSPTISGIRKGGNYGFDPVMRGFKYDQLNIVMNGTQCATAACPNRMDPPTSQMAPNMLEKVEIFKGPYAMRYGGGLGGTINYVTGEAAFSNHTNLIGRLSGRYDSNGDVLKTEGMLGFTGKKYNVGFFGSWAEGNDYADGSDAIVGADFQRSSFGLKTAIKASSNQVINLSAFLNQAKDVDFPALRMDLRSDKTLMLNASHKVIFESQKLQSWETSVFLSAVDHLMDNKLKPLDPRMMDASTDAQTNNYGARTEGHWKSGRTKLYLGGDFKVEDAQGLRERNFLLGPMAGKTVIDNAWQHGKIQKIGVFSEYNFPLKTWALVLSGRLELNNATVLDADPGFLEEYQDPNVTQINPSLSLGGIKELKDGISIGIWVARAQRSASLAERYINKFSIGLDPFEMLGNPNLEAEVNNQVDLTFEWKTTKSNFSIDVFGGYMQNFISSVIDPTIPTLLPNSPGVRRFINIDNAYKTGIEVGLYHRFTPWLYNELNLAYTYAKDIERDQPLPEIAPMDIRFSICGNFMKDRLKPTLKVRYVMDQNRVSTEFGETTTPGFTTIDFNIGYRLGNNLNFQFGVNNILNETYYEHLSRSTASANPIPLNAQGRNFYLAFGYEIR